MYTYESSFQEEKVNRVQPLTSLNVAQVKPGGKGKVALSTWPELLIKILI